MAKILFNTDGMPAGRLRELLGCGISGAEAAAAAGIDPEISQLALWAEKTDKLDYKTNLPAEKFTSADVQLIGREFRKAYGKTVRECDEVFAHDELPFMTAMPLFFVDGENAAVDAREIPAGFPEELSEITELPEFAAAQACHDMAVLGCGKIYLALFKRGCGELKFFEAGNCGKCGWIINAEKHFWLGHVKLGLPPAPRGNIANGANNGNDDTDAGIFKQLAAARLVKSDDPEKLAAPFDLDEYSETVRELFELRKNIKELQEREKLLKDEIISQIPDNSVGFTGEFRVELSRQNRRIVDTQKLKTEFAEIYEQCQKNSTAEYLRIFEF